MREEISLTITEKQTAVEALVAFGHSTDPVESEAENKSSALCYLRFSIIA